MLKMDDKNLDHECDDLSKPSKEDYEKALKDLEFARNSLHLCRKRKDHLIEELCKEQESEKIYTTCFERARCVIRKYEIYQDIESNT